MNTRQLNSSDAETLFSLLNERFEKNMPRHAGLEWKPIASRLSASPGALWSLSEMERTGGEPDVIGFDQETGAWLFADCSAESPAGRRSLCYDRGGFDARKEHKPAGSAMEMAAAMGIEMLTEAQYRRLQTLGRFDTRTSSWLKTPDAIRQPGGAIFAEFRYSQIFVFHNSAPSYYSSRGFRAMLMV
jgi:hypothetical protein